MAFSMFSNMSDSDESLFEHYELLTWLSDLHDSESDTDTTGSEADETEEEIPRGRSPQQPTNANEAKIDTQSFSPADRALCIREFYKNGSSATIAREKFCKIRGYRYFYQAPSILTIQKWVKTFEETGSTENEPKSEHPSSVKTKMSVQQDNRSDGDKSSRESASALSKDK